MTEKKTPTAPEGGDNVNELAKAREEIAYWRGRAEAGGEAAGAKGLDRRQGDVLDVWLTSTVDLPDKFGLKPLPQRWVALQERGSSTCAIFMATLGTKSPHYRLTKMDWPHWVPADQGPAIRLHPDAKRVVDLASMRSGVPEMYRREAILAMENGTFDASKSSFSYEEIAAARHGYFGHGKRGDHARITRLHQPVRRLAGLTDPEALPLCTYFEWLEEGQPIPQAWFDLLAPTGSDLLVYEVETPIPSTIDPAKDLFDNPPAKPSPPTGPGRY